MNGRRWVASKATFDRKIWASFCGKDPIHIVKCGPLVVAAVWGDDDEDPEAEEKAARLIAAAPEMLKALEASLDHLEIALDNAWDDKEGAKILKATIRQVEKTLAKARGDLK